MNINISFWFLETQREIIILQSFRSVSSDPHCIISADEDPTLRIEGFAIIKFGVSTKLKFYLNTLLDKYTKRGWAQTGLEVPCEELLQLNIQHKEHTNENEETKFYRVYQKKVDNFETALNLAKRLQVWSFLLI